MTQINAYLTFNGNCREAMTFYKECLGGELLLQTVEGSPMEVQCPSAMKQNILHSTLTKGELVLMASDRLSSDEYIQSNSISLTINCSSEEEINTFYTKLSAGGKIREPLKIQFWGALFGVFTDKYGIQWMANYDPKQ